MKAFKDDKGFGCFLTGILLAAILLGGCAATTNYSYDPAMDFSTAKNYSWESGVIYTNPHNPLIDQNIRYFADQSLQNKGFTLTPDQPDFVISMNYETEYSDPYKIRVLTLYVYGTQRKGRIWQGTAKGPISVDAASSDLGGAVQKILTNFPPR